MFLLEVAKGLTNDEMVKQMQEQVISMQDKQMSFLNDTIANTNETITIVVTILGVLSAAVITWIGFMQRNAKKKMDEAEVKMNEASEQLTHAESLVSKVAEDIEKLDKYRKEVDEYKVETERKFQELDASIDKRLEDLKQLEDKTNNLFYDYHVKEKLGFLRKRLDDIKKGIELLNGRDDISIKEVLVLDEVNKEYEIIEGHYDRIKSGLGTTILEEIFELDKYCTNAFNEAGELVFKLENAVFLHQKRKAGL